MLTCTKPESANFDAELCVELYVCVSGLWVVFVVVFGGGKTAVGGVDLLFDFSTRCRIRAGRNQLQQWEKSM